MKNRVAVLFALMIGFSYNPSASAAAFAGNEGQIIESVKETGEEIEQAEKDKEQSEDGNKSGQKPGDRTSASQAKSGIKNLQIPQKLDVVIDPWEMDNKGQIYSEQYMISNVGDTAGVLTLSGLICRPREQSGVVIRTNREGLHDNGDKTIYIEMLLGNGEKVVFSQESSQYQTKLEPGEKLSVCFAGEVNENALGEWKNDDISISMVYSWETESEAEDMDLKELEENPQDDIEDTGKEESDKSKGDSANQEKNEIKNIDLLEPQKVDVVIDSWKVDEEGRIVTQQYLLQNTGNTVGIWDLSELICKPREQSTTAIKTDKSELHNSGEKAVYMELVIGNGEKITLSQEKSEYKVELRPGEQLLIRFVGEMNGNLFETYEEGDITVTAVCTWNPQ